MSAADDKLLPTNTRYNVSYIFAKIIFYRKLTKIEAHKYWNFKMKNHAFTKLQEENCLNKQQNTQGK